MKHKKTDPAKTPNQIHFARFDRLDDWKTKVSSMCPIIKTANHRVGSCNVRKCAEQ